MPTINLQAGKYVKPAITFKRVAIAQIVMAIGAFALWWSTATSASIRAPLDGDSYAHNWGFQSEVGTLYVVGILIFTSFFIVLERGAYDLWIWWKLQRSHANPTRSDLFNPKMGLRETKSVKFIKCHGIVAICLVASGPFAVAQSTLSDANTDVLTIRISEDGVCNFLKDSAPCNQLGESLISKHLA